MNTFTALNTSTAGGELDGRTAVVTGSSRGIGRAIAVLFAQRGAAVVLHGRDRAALAKVHEEITGDRRSHRRR
jgi:NAD(P)-dependent dehydrogenase (short-subunit alcohol dehydrogenase family)